MYNEKTIKNYILEQKDIVIAFDCFDTLLSRRVSPEYVIKLWAKELINMFSINSTVEKICELLITLNIQHTNDSLSLSRKIKNTFNIREDEKCIEQKLIQLIINTECRVTYINKDISELLYFVKSINKHIILISDYYLSKKYLYEILIHHGMHIYFNNIFVSCDYMATKSSGDLYKVVLRELDLKPYNLLMIGDNIYSDCKSAAMQDIKSYYVNREKYFLDYDTYDKKYANVKSTLKNSIIFSDAIKDNGLQNIAFSLYAFTDRLYSLLLSKNIRHIFFLAREGKFLKKLFDLYRQEQGYQNEQYIESDYLYVSRRSAHIACLRKLDQEDFGILFKRNNYISIYIFLLTLNFDNDEIKNIENSLPNIDITRKILLFSSSEEFSILLNLELFQSIYEEKRKDQRKNILNYFKQIKLDNPIYIVDIGWTGTMQNCIYQLYRKKRRIIGFYYGHEHSDDYCFAGDKKNQKHGIMFTINVNTKKNNRNRNKIDKMSAVYSAYNNSDFYLLYEMFTTCEDGSTIFYTKNEIIFDNKEEEKQRFLNKIKPIQDEILSLYCKILDDFKLKAILFDDYKNEFMKIQMKLWLKIKQDKILENYKDFFNVKEEQRPNIWL